MWQLVSSNAKLGKILSVLSRISVYFCVLLIFANFLNIAERVIVLFTYGFPFIMMFTPLLSNFFIIVFCVGLILITNDVWGFISGPFRISEVYELEKHIILLFCITAFLIYFVFIPIALLFNNNSINYIDLFISNGSGKFLSMVYPSIALWGVISQAIEVFKNRVTTIK